MTLTLPTPDLKAAVATCAKVTQPGHPALAGIHLAAIDGTATLTAGNSEMVVTLQLEATDTEGEALVGARLLADVVSRCPGDTISLTPAPDHLAVASGRWRAKLPVTPAAEYEPYFLRDPEGDPVAFDGDTLLATVAQVAVTASTDKTRAMLAGVHFEPEEGGLRLTANDSYRMSTRHLEGATVAAPAIVPAEALALLASQHQPGDKVEVWTSGHAAQFRTGRLALSTTLVAGTYPSWRNVLPVAQPAGWLTLEDPADLAGAVLRNGRAFGGDLTLVHLTLTPEGTVAIEAVTADVGEGTEEVPALWTGPELEITFNAKYLADALNNFNGAPVTAAVIDRLKPVVFRAAGDIEPDGDAQPDDLHVLVPVNRSKNR